MYYEGLTIIPPITPCVNKCPFCIARMFNQDYSATEKLFPNILNTENGVLMYKEKLAVVSNNTDCKKLLITGLNEPLQNIKFLKQFAAIHNSLDKKFEYIEIQTTGFGLTEKYLNFLENELHVDRLAISVSSFNKEENNNIDVKDVCELLRNSNIKVRLCFNLLETMQSFTLDDYINFAKEYNADEVLFRHMYAGTTSSESDYVNAHKLNPDLEMKLYNEVQTYKRTGEILYGTPVINVKGISVLYEMKDDNNRCRCEADTKYLFLRTNAKLYDNWYTTDEIDYESFKN